MKYLRNSFHPLAAWVALALVSATAAFTANAGSASLYVQDGLIACWDGIENAGAGQAHNPATTVWKDLVAGREFNLNSVTVNDDRMTFAGNADSYGALSAIDTTATFVSRSGTALFVSWKRELTTPEIRDALETALRRAAKVQPVGEPLDWMEHLRPVRWRFGDEIRNYNWE